LVILKSLKILKMTTTDDNSEVGNIFAYLENDGNNEMPSVSENAETLINVIINNVQKETCEKVNL
jgi:hypothetical protein